MRKNTSNRRIVVAAIVVALCAVMFTRALAAYDVTHNFATWDWDWYTGSEDYPNADYDQGNGWVAEVNRPDSYYRNSVYIFVNFDEANVDTLYVNYDLTWGTIDYNGLAFRLDCLRDDVVIAQTYSSVSGTTDGTGVTESVAVADDCDQAAVLLIASISSTEEGANSGSAVINYVRFVSATEDNPFADWQQDAYYRPLVDDDIYEVNHVTGYGPIVDDVHTEYQAEVYAAFDGTVVFMQVESAGYTVKLLNEDNETYAIYSNLEAVYPQLNDVVEQGCKLGLVGESFKEPSETYTQSPGLLWFYSGTDFYDYEENTYIDWQNDWDEPDELSDICGTSLRTDHCINYNPNLESNATGWVTLGVDAYQIADDSIILDTAQDSISQYMTLDDAEDYYITIAYVPHFDYDFLTVGTFKGTTLDLIDTILEEVDLTDTPALVGTRQVVEVGPIDLSDPDANDIYLISILLANASGESWVEIDDVCIHTGDATVSTQYCYFDNYQLDGDTDWDYDAGADWGNNPGTYDSSVTLEADEWISQAISLSSYDGDDCDYRLTVTARVMGGTIGDLIDIFGGWTGDIAQEVWSAGPSLEIDIGDETINNALIFHSYYTDFTVTDGNTLVGDLTITADTGNTYDIEIDTMCIEPVTGIWPGSGDEDIAGPDRASCESCVRPTGLAVTTLAQWVVWLWCNLVNFFQCTLAEWIASIGTLLRQVRDYLGLFGRYVAAVVGRYATWLLSVFAALAGALQDVFHYVLAAVWNAIADLGLLEALFDLIGYAQAILLGLATLGAYTFDLILDFFQMLLVISRLVQEFFSAMSEAFTGSVPDIAFPSCSSSQTIQGFCIVFEIADGIFSEFTALPIAITIDIALIGFITIVWSVRRFGSAIGDV